MMKTPENRVLQSKIKVRHPLSLNKKDGGYAKDYHQKENAQNHNKTTLFSKSKGDVENLENKD